MLTRFVFCSECHSGIGGNGRRRVCCPIPMIVSLIQVGEFNTQFVVEGDIARIIWHFAGELV